MQISTKFEPCLKILKHCNKNPGAEGLESYNGAQKSHDTVLLKDAEIGKC